jgi:hypothetical protein
MADLVYAALGSLRVQLLSELRVAVVARPQGSLNLKLEERFQTDGCRSGRQRRTDAAARVTDS